MNQPWTAPECFRLTILYEFKTAAECARIMKRKLYSVQAQVRRMKLSKSPAIAGALRQRRNTSQIANAGTEAAAMAPDKPTVKPAVALANVCYGKPRAPMGLTINGDRLAREVACRT